MSRPSYSSWCDRPNNIWWAVEITQLLIMQFPTLPYYLLPLRTIYLPQHPILKHPQPIYIPPSKLKTEFHTRVKQQAKNVTNLPTILPESCCESGKVRFDILVKRGLHRANKRQDEVVQLLGSPRKSACLSPRKYCCPITQHHGTKAKPVASKHDRSYNFLIRLHEQNVTYWH
jgi:hypothetical protein